MSAIELFERRFGKKYPDYKKMLDYHFVSVKGKEVPSWSDYSYAPISTSIAIISQGDNVIGNSMSCIADANIMSGLAGWIANGKKIRKIDELEEYRKTRGLYYDDLIVDSEKIFKSIGYGIYVEYPFKDMFNEMYDGALLYIEYDTNLSRLELRANLLKKNKKDVMALVLHLLDGEHLSECLFDTLNFTEKQINEVRRRKVVTFKELLATSLLDLESTQSLMYYFYDYTFSNILAFIL